MAELPELVERVLMQERALNRVRQSIALLDPLDDEAHKNSVMLVLIEWERKLDHELAINKNLLYGGI